MSLVSRASVARSRPMGQAQRRLALNEARRERHRAWKRPAMAAAGAGLALVTVWAFTYKVPSVGRWDKEALNGFWALQRPTLIGTQQTLTDSVDAVPFALIAIVLLSVATYRRRPALMASVVAILAGANFSTEALKSLMPEHLGTVPPFAASIIHGPSFPSGHATACLSLVLCAVLVAPRRLRPFVASAGALYAIALGYSILVLATHYPSDVAGGFLMALLWTLLVVAALHAAEGRRPAHRPVAQSPDRSETITYVVWAVAAIAASTGLAIAGAPHDIGAPAIGAAGAVIAAVPAVGVCVLAGSL